MAATDTNSTPTTVPIWTPFQYRVFTAIWLAALFSDLGLWMQSVGASWLITKTTSSSLYVSLMVTATSLPIFLLGVPAGALSDVFNKRKILLMTQFWMFLIAVLLAVFGFINYTPPILILILSCLLSFGPAISETAWQATVPEIVPASSLAPAITLNGVSINLARSLGPAVGGLVLSYYSPTAVFLINAICFLGTFCVVYFWSGTKSSETLLTERFIGSMKIGVNYMRYASNLHPTLIRAVIFGVGASALFGLLPVVVLNKLHLNVGTYGAMLFCIGGGAIFAAVFLSKISSLISINQKLIISTLLVGVNLILLNQVQNTYVLFISLFFTGMAWLMSMSSFNVIIQTNVPGWVLSRAISIYLLLFQGGMALGGFVWGMISDEVGIEYTLYSAAAWLGASLLLGIFYSLKKVDTVDLTIPLRTNEIVPTLEVTNLEGPVLVLVDYIIEQKDIRAFTTAADDLRGLRLRNGASQVGLFQNVVSPTTITEFFIVESWAEYLMQVQRYTVYDLDVEKKILAFHSGTSEPQQRVMIAQVAK